MVHIQRLSVALGKSGLEPQTVAGWIGEKQLGFASHVISQHSSWPSFNQFKLVSKFTPNNSKNTLRMPSVLIVTGCEVGVINAYCSCTLHLEVRAKCHQHRARCYKPTAHRLWPASIHPSKVTMCDYKSKIFCLETMKYFVIRLLDPRSVESQCSDAHSSSI